MILYRNIDIWIFIMSPCKQQMLYDALIKEAAVPVQQCSNKQQQNSA